MRRVGSLVLSLALLSAPVLAVAADSAKEPKGDKPAAHKHAGRRHHRPGAVHKPTGEPKADKQ